MICYIIFSYFVDLAQKLWWTLIITPAKIIRLLIFALSFIFIDHREELSLYLHELLDIIERQFDKLALLSWKMIDELEIFFQHNVDAFQSLLVGLGKIKYDLTIFKINDGY